MDINFTEHRHPNEAFIALRGYQIKGDSGDRAIEVNAPNGPIGLAMGKNRNCSNGHFAFLGQAKAPLIINTDDTATRVRRSEQTLLGLEVMLHITVVIEVIMLKIRERSDIKNNVVNTVQTQRMR